MRLPLVEALLSVMGLQDASTNTLARYDLDVLRCKNARRAHQITKRVLREHLRRIDDHFGAHLPFILLKGEPLEALLFGGKMPRGTGDLDLLIRPEDLASAQNKLEYLGFSPLLDEPPRRWANNQQAFIHHRQKILVELHWSLALPGLPHPPLEELFHTSERFTFDDGLSVPILRPDWLFFHLALHFHHHLGFAKGLLDMAAWCDRYGSTSDLEELLWRAKRLRMTGLIQWPLRTLLLLVGPLTPLPQLVLPRADAATLYWSQLSARALRNCLQNKTPTPLEEALNAVMHELATLPGLTLQALSMLLLDGWSAKARGVCRPFLFGPHRIGRQLSKLQNALPLRPR